MSVHIRLVAYALMAAASFSICVFISNPVALAIAVVPLALYLPGATILLAIDREGKIFIENGFILWSFGTSVAVVVLGGLLLDLIASLDRVSWLAYLSAVIWIALLISFGRLVPIGKKRVHQSDRSDMNRMRWVISGLCVASLGALLAGSELKATSAAHQITIGKALSGSLATCPAIDATATIHFDAAKSPAGTYQILALGSVRNLSPKRVQNVVVRWVVTYADRSTGLPTETHVTGWLIPGRGEANWGGLVANDDGSVPPTGVKITGILGAPGNSICTP